MALTDTESIKEVYQNITDFYEYSLSHSGKQILMPKCEIWIWFSQV